MSGPAPRSRANTPPSSLLEVKVVPNAPCTAIVGWSGETLKVKLAAPPVDGKANDELCRWLAEVLGVHRGEVALVRGETSRSKWVQVRGWTQPAIRARLTGSA